MHTDAYYPARFFTAIERVGPSSLQHVCASFSRAKAKQLGITRKSEKFRAFPSIFLRASNSPDLPFSSASHLHRPTVTRREGVKPKDGFNKKSSGVDGRQWSRVRTRLIIYYWYWINNECSLTAFIRSGCLLNPCEFCSFAKFQMHYCRYISLGYSYISNLIFLLRSRLHEYINR